MSITCSSVAGRDPKPSRPVSPGPRPSVDRGSRCVLDAWDRGAGPLIGTIEARRAHAASTDRLMAPPVHGQARPAEPDQCWPRLARFDSGCLCAAKRSAALTEPEAFRRKTHAPDSSVTEVVDRPTEGVGPDAWDRYGLPCAGCAPCSAMQRHGPGIGSRQGRSGPEWGLRIQNGGPPRTAVPKSQLSGAQAGT